jgi:hypothetical protein
MADDQAVDLGSVMDTLTAIQRSLESLNATPTTAVGAPASQGVEDQAQATPVTRQFMSRADMLQLKDNIRYKAPGVLRSVPELQQLLAAQADRRDTGIPLDVWANTGGYATQVALASNPQLQKALDSAGGSALIRQDLEPVLQELFIREFPAYERFGRVPANGLVHAFDQVTAFGSAVFMPELGTVTDDQSTYVRQTTNVAILATRRGVSFKGQFATVQSGSGFNPQMLEMQGGLRAIAHELQKAIFQGNATNSGGAAASEFGLYDANAFTGLRWQLNSTRVKNVDPTAGTPEDMRAAIDRASEEIVEQGGRASIIWCHPHEKVSFDLQQDANVRYMNQFVDVAVGVQTNAVNTVFGPLPLAVVPGDSIGTYNSTHYSNNLVRDMYVLDESSISLPYLGSEGPTVLEIPPGVAGQLTRLFIIFGMWGLAVRALPFSNKVRVKQ